MRDWRAGDLPIYREWLRPHHEWHDWDGPYFPVPDDAEADTLVRSLGSLLDQPRTAAPPRRAVVADRGTDSLIGVVSWYYECEVSDWRRVGITVFDPSHRGRGVGLEALTLWAAHLFSSTGIRRLDFATWSGNAAMCRVGEKAGWREEARFRDAREVRGEVYDAVVFGVTRGEWERTAPTRSGVSP
ncbi:GNAT family N-acetyltransferase [Arthrobacter sp. NamB2]|nr:GNAT family protein [Arthrobacter sp. NamB2]TKV28693.1 GNAT family N-acetyltransferase [Arthrobacter sp. NamB2]